MIGQMFKKPKESVSIEKFKIQCPVAMYSNELCIVKLHIELQPHALLDITGSALYIVIEHEGAAVLNRNRNYYQLKEKI